VPVTVEKQSVPPVTSAAAVPGGGSICLHDGESVSPAHVRQLGGIAREALYQLGEDDLSLRRIGRFVNVLPVAPFGLYPFLLPWLLRVSWRTARALRRPELKNLRQRADLTAVKALQAGRRAEQTVDPETPALIALKNDPWGLTLAVLGPPALVAGFVGLWWLLIA